MGNEGLTAEAERAHEALEGFYDQFAAATNMAYVGDEGARVLALRLVPRARDLHRRTKRPATDSPAAVVPAPAPAAPVVPRP